MRCCRTILCLLGPLVFLPACTRQSIVSTPPPQVVSYVDLTRYTGTWYEIARTPNSFQEGCFESRATYSLRRDNRLSVTNTCRRNGFDGQTDTVSGKAWVVDQTTNAKLKVSFFWPIAGDYWIIDLGREYEYAVVATPGRQHLWVLSRSPVMADSSYEAIVDRIRAKGFDPTRLVKTPQRLTRPK
jgi:apolipoprotein D and lipocalin family protein